MPGNLFKIQVFYVQLKFKAITTGDKNDTLLENES